MRRAVIVICAALLCVPVVLKSRTNQEVPDRAAFRTFSSGRIMVKVSGDVLHAGVYDISANSLADTVIKLAIPANPLKSYKYTPSALLPLQNGAAVQLSAQPDGSQVITIGEMTASERLVLNIPLDISVMSEADFDRLPGIGPALARRIIEYRQNNGGILRVEDLLKVDGIGEKKCKMLLGYFQHAVNKR
ncbi:MAG: helix-hairpin-helix domain-containing protein [Desulfuromonadaceae bacterium]|nr:helix-hairpin-helix domain-containing protein [Desulfuromonadaceae bacterium]